MVELSLRSTTKLVVKIGLDLLSVVGGAGGIVQLIGVLSTVWLTFNFTAAASASLPSKAENKRVKACFKTTLPAEFLRTRKKFSATLVSAEFLSLQTASLRLVNNNLHATASLASITVPVR